MQDIIDHAKRLQTRIAEIGQQINVSAMQAQLHALEVEMQDPEFWNNTERAQQVSRQVSEMQREIDMWQQLEAEVQTVAELASIAEGDVNLEKELHTKLEQLQAQFAEVEFKLLLNEEFDTSDAIIEVHAGAGGVDAQDWAEMLLRMITRYCELRNYSVKVIDVSRGTEAGIKSARLEVAGRYAYGYLKSEHGVHRLVRQSPFNADALRQTSFAKLEVLPDLGELNPIEVKDEDIRIDVFRAGGNGGQSVNTTDSAVRIVHLATNITVSCQNEKSQHQNKASAMKILKARLYQLQLEEQRAEREKIRGGNTTAEWGNQIRSYVLHPYKMVKDHRTEYEESNPDDVLDGKLEGFVEAYLKQAITPPSR